MGGGEGLLRGEDLDVGLEGFGIEAGRKAVGEEGLPAGGGEHGGCQLFRRL